MTGQPYIPESIVVHLGTPDSNAQNVTISFPDYLKNVASSEIYPTWPENSLRANIYAQVSFALNRIYTEWYRSRGYDFDITNSTSVDQAFVYGRNIYEDVDRIVDELFNDYLTKQDNIQPFFAQFCNGTTVTCAGLSQWGTVSLANQGYTPYEILQYYYGDDINIVQDAPVRINAESFPDGFCKSARWEMTWLHCKNISTEFRKIILRSPKSPPWMECSQKIPKMRSRHSNESLILLRMVWSERQPGIA